MMDMPARRAGTHFGEFVNLLMERIAHAKTTIKKV